MPAKPKPAAPHPEPTKATRCPATPDERGDTDVGGSGASYSIDNRPRQPVQGHRREALLPKKRPDSPRTLGVDDHRDEIAAEIEKAFRTATLRARRLGLH
jgi:hypothetical protein